MVKFFVSVIAAALLSTPVLGLPVPSKGLQARNECSVTVLLSKFLSLIQHLLPNSNGVVHSVQLQPGQPCIVHNNGSAGDDGSNANNNGSGGDDSGNVVDNNNNGSDGSDGSDGSTVDNNNNSGSDSGTIINNNGSSGNSTSGIVNDNGSSGDDSGSIVNNNGPSGDSGNETVNVELTDLTVLAPLAAATIVTSTKMGMGPSVFPLAVATIATSTTSTTDANNPMLPVWSDQVAGLTKRTTSQSLFRMRPSCSDA
ncbi:hypothetical protein CVT26_006587 [Gymnopilus dilepis]|uniref:Hydrophobin n=1 Tax=Gymnopilus dilepis TaxID=231916 RepID=A0A409Y302_9AGAR|nr:hypothetical protein CVT26_006587 [Gymnopilus dilepis]